MRSISEIRKNLRIGTETVNRILKEKGILVKWEGRKKGISDEDYKSVEDFVRINQSKYSSRYWLVAYEYGEVIPVSQAASLLRIGVAKLKRTAKELDISFIEGGQARFITRAKYEIIKKHLGVITDESTRGWISPNKDQKSLFEDQPSTTDTLIDFSRFQVDEKPSQKAIIKLKEKVNAKEKVESKKEKSKKTKEQELSAKVFDLDSENRLMIREINEKDDEIKSLKEKNETLRNHFNSVSSKNKRLNIENGKLEEKVKQLESVKYAIDTLIKISNKPEL